MTEKGTISTMGKSPVFIGTDSRNDHNDHPLGTLGHRSSCREKLWTSSAKVFLKHDISETRKGVPKNRLELSPVVTKKWHLTGEVLTFWQKHRHFESSLFSEVMEQRAGLDPHKISQHSIGS